MRRGDDTRSRILLASADLFSQRGFETVTMREIAAAVGIKCSSLYNYFSGKSEIIDYIVDYFLTYINKHELSVDNVEMMLLTDTPETILRRGLLLYTINDTKVMKCILRIVFMEQYRNDKIRKILYEEIIEKNTRKLENILNKLTELEAIPPCDCHHLAEVWLNSVIVNTMEWTHSSRDELGDNLHLLLNFFVSTYLNKPITEYHCDSDIKSM